MTGATSRDADPRIFLTESDIFYVARSLIWAERNAKRRVLDIYGDELALMPGQSIAMSPIEATPEDREHYARRLTDFFGCPEAWEEVAELESLGEWSSKVAALCQGRPRFMAFYTSGSTGEPKRIAREYDQMEQDARAMAEHMQGARRMLSMVSPHHIYGVLNSVMIPKILDAIWVDKRYVTPHGLLDGLRDDDHIVSIPFFWEKLDDILDRFPARVDGTTSTAPMSPELGRSLLDKGIRTLTAWYGSSESGAMGYKQNPHGPYTLFDFWERAGENEFYRRMPDGSRAGPFEFQDSLDWRSENVFYVQKRLDHAVQVAGVNVHPGRVERVLQDHPIVRECAVRLMRPDEGERLKAFIVLEDEHDADKAREVLTRHCVERLSHVERPKSLRFGDNLPRNQMGKLTDWDGPEE